MVKILQPNHNTPSVTTYTLHLLSPRTALWFTLPLCAWLARAGDNKLQHAKCPSVAVFNCVEFFQHLSPPHQFNTTFNTLLQWFFNFQHIFNTTIVNGLMWKYNVGLVGYMLKSEQNYHSWGTANSCLNLMESNNV
jgi:hypothetical protein